MRPTTVAAVLAFALAACTPPSINPSINLQLAPPAPEGFAVSLLASAAKRTCRGAGPSAAQDVESATYAWFLDDRPLGSNRDHLTLTFRNPGTFEVTVAATNAAGVTATDSVSITVEDETEVVDSA
jgi:membrane carboxypeptidase/penicillin-binding protein PbpC